MLKDKPEDQQATAGEAGQLPTPLDGSQADRRNTLLGNPAAAAAALLGERTPAHTAPPAERERNLASVDASLTMRDRIARAQRLSQFSSGEESEESEEESEAEAPAAAGFQGEDEEDDEDELEAEAG